MLDQTSVISNKNYLAHYSIYILREILARQVANWSKWRLNTGRLNSYALRLFFAFGIGFTDRKLRLALFDVGQFFAPSVNISKAMKVSETEVSFSLLKTAKWMSQKFKITKVKPTVELNSLYILTEEQLDIQTKEENKNVNTIIKNPNYILKMG